MERQNIYDNYPFRVSTYSIRNREICKLWVLLPDEPWAKDAHAYVNKTAEYNKDVLEDHYGVEW